MKPINPIWRYINIPVFFINPNKKEAISNKICLAEYWFNISSSYKIIFFFVLVPFFCYSQEHFLQSHGTTIISVIKNDTIWIGADSKATLSIGESIVGFDSTCKIRRFNDFVIAHAGLNSFINFYVDSLITTIIRDSLDFYSMMERFKSEMRTKMSVYSFIKYIFSKSRRDIIFNSSIIFAKFINGTPKIFFHKYVTSISNKLPDTSFKIDSSDYVSGGLPFYDYNSTASISYVWDTNIINKIDIIIQRRGTPFLISELIKMDALRNNSVGGQVSIICLTKDSIEWVDGYKGLCEP